MKGSGTHDDLRDRNHHQTASGSTEYDLDGAGSKIGVNSKTISKWETAKGLPDISLLQPLAQALDISVIELMNGEHIINKNVSANMLRSKFYVCPIYGNVIQALFYFGSTPTIDIEPKALNSEEFRAFYCI